MDKDRIAILLLNADCFMRLMDGRNKDSTYQTMKLKKCLIVFYLGVDSSAVEILNTVDIRTEGNTELSMRIMTDVKSNSEFFSDLNGFQVRMTRRILTAYVWLSVV